VDHGRGFPQFPFSSVQDRSSGYHGDEHTGHGDPGLHDAPYDSGRLTALLFQQPYQGSKEITEYMMVCLTWGCLSAPSGVKAVSMALVANKFPKQFQAFIDAFTNLIGFVAISFLSWQLYKEVVNAREISFPPRF
jgi:hypothetical protein